LEAFDYRWPVNTEHFDSGWQVVVAIGGRERRARIGLGWRESYGAVRRRLVVWIDGQPVAEGAGTDDYESSRSLVCALKHADQRLVRPGDEVPVAYARFPLVNQAQEIDGPYNRRALAVKLRETDPISWIGFALARLAARAGTPSATTPPGNPSASSVPPQGGHKMTASDRGLPSVPADHGAIVRALLEFGVRHTPAEVGAATFTPHPEANALIINNPFAFLLAVIFDQGIPAERAWRAPYDMMQRLGHLDPQR
jgi:hypothetical protein